MPGTVDEGSAGDPVVIQLNGGIAGLPALDGSLLTNVSATGTPTSGGLSLCIGGRLDTLTTPYSGLGSEEVAKTGTISSIAARRGVTGTAGTTTIQVEINGVAVSGATLSWTTTDTAFALKTATFTAASVNAGDRVSLLLSSAEVSGQDVFAKVY